MRVSRMEAIPETVKLSVLRCFPLCELKRLEPTKGTAQHVTGIQGSEAGGLCGVESHGF